MAGAIFIPSTFTHLVLDLIDFKRGLRDRIIQLNYLISVLFLLFCFTPHYIEFTEQRLFFPHWPKPGPVFHFMLLHFMINVVLGHVLMWQAIAVSAGIKRNQIKYVFLGTLIGFGGGSTNYFLWYNIWVPPYLNSLVSVYISTLAYAIAKHRLMDINIAITRTAIFILVYTAAIGASIVAGSVGKKWFIRMLGIEYWALAPSVLCILLCALAPAAYEILRGRAEERLLREQRRYQQTLLQASRGMTLIKDLKHLLNLTVHILTRTIRLTHASIYLFDEDSHTYQCHARRNKITLQFMDNAPEDSALSRYLHKARRPLVADEVRFKGPHGDDSLLGQVQSELEHLKAAVAIPSFVQEKLVGYLILGEKKSGQIYTGDDLTTLSTLANQAALAIENCRFLEEFEKTQAVIFQTAKMMDLGTMAAGIGHQMNNRFNHITIGADMCLLDDMRKLRQAAEESHKENILKHADEMEVKLRKMKAQAMHGHEIVKRLLDFSRLSEEFEPLQLGEAVETGVAFWKEYRQGLDKFEFVMQIEPNLPPIKGNFSTLQEVVINFLNNAADAILMKQEDWEMGRYPRPDPAEPAKVGISLQKVERSGRSFVEMKVEDTGNGMTEETKRKVYVPFFTTKATAIKGTGVGMFLIKEIVERAHQGEIYCETEYGKGTTFRVYFQAL